MESPQQLELVGGRAGAAVLCAKCRAASGLCINYFQICTLYIGEGGRHVLLLWLEYMNTLNKGWSPLYGVGCVAAAVSRFTMWVVEAFEGP